MCCACDPNERLSAPSICFCMSEVISSFRSLRAGSQVFALLMLFLCVILHTMSSGKSLLMCTLTIRSSVLCVLIVEGMSVVVNVMVSLISVMSPPPALCNLSVRTAVKLCILGVFGFRGVLGFLNCDDVCMCVVNEQFELLEFVSESVYVDLQYDEISLTFTAVPVCLCVVSSPVVVLGLFVRLS